LFDDTKLCAIGFNSYEIDKATDVCHDRTIRLRILRRNALRYEKPIHEMLTRTDGSQLKAKLLEDYVLSHTGYSDAVVMQKFIRNIELLEEERKSLSDPFKLYHNAMYLMRDSFYYEDYDRAGVYLAYLLSHDELHIKVYNLLPYGYLKHLYTSAHVAEACRDKFNRKEIYDKVFRRMKELYPGEWDAIPAELHYQLRFDYREDRFLSELDKTAPSMLRALPREFHDRRLIEANIYEQAAEACHMRGDKRKTCLYAYRALECMPVIEGRPLLLLLYSLKDHRFKDAKRIIKSAALPGRPDVATHVIDLLRVQGEREKLFANAEPQQLFPSEAGPAGVYGARETEASRIALFRMKSEKLFASMRYADITADPDAADAAKKDYGCAYYVAYAFLIQGKYRSAYDTVTPHISNGIINQALLSILLVTAEKLPESMAADVKRRYEEYMSILSEAIDLQDVINTGAVYEADTISEQRAMRELTHSDFLDAYKKDKDRPATDMLLRQHQQAAVVYEKNGCVFKAAESYRLLAAKGHDAEKNTGELRRLFNESGNNELTRFLEIFMKVDNTIN
jgi:hypothetical protein